MNLKPYVPGTALVLLIAFFSFILSKFNPSFDAQVVSIIIGMFVGNYFARQHSFLRGVEGGITVLLPAGIALHGTQVVVTGMSGSYILFILLVCLAFFGLTLLLSRVFNLERKTAILLASGLSTCGAAAVAIISPIIGARREDTSVSIVSLMMIGFTGMIFYPIINDLFSLSRGEFNFLAGATLPMLGQVKVAAASVCPECLDEAVKINFIRLSFFLFPVTAAIFLADKEKKQMRVPWFIIIFFAGALVVNTTGIFNIFLAPLKTLSGFFLSAGLASIGYCVDFEAVIDEGITPLGVLFLVLGVVLLLMYFIRNIF
ncbi:MAG: hypothetical protein C0402_08535 [Thermodesulfovibrio sp.]|nr:hypothetical protein [Thermodesulfovibrio sp.]